MKHFIVETNEFTATTPPDDVVRGFSWRSCSEAANLSCVADLGMTLLDANPDRIQLIDAAGKLLWMNQAARSRQRTGTAETDWATQVAGYWPKLAARQFAGAIADAEHGGRPRFTISTRESGGPQWWDVRVTRIAAADRVATRYLIIAQDVSAQHRASAAAARAVGHDTLTGLAGSDLFRHHIEALVAAGDTDFCVLIVDIDQFRDHRDRLGIDACDAVLCTVAARLGRSLRKGEMVARLGSDEFGVVWRDNNRNCLDSAELRARAIVDRLAKSSLGHALPPGISVSIGLARLLPGSGASAMVCRNAQHALLAAKAVGRGQVVQYGTALRKSQEAKETMLADAEWALTNKKILPHYQPKVDLKSGRIIGFEALLRWRSSSGTIEPPSSIWPAFANPTLSRRITETMVGRVILDLRRWQRRGIELSVAINVADSDLHQPDFAERLIAGLAAASLPLSSIEIEITETAVLGRNSEPLAAMLCKLNAAGIRIALDDFGTGYASLLHLKQLPVDVIKIDRSFVSNLRSDTGDRAIVEAMLRMARQLGIEVVAEGIENAADACFLRDRGCNVGQGFLFGKAVPACEVPALLAAPPMKLPAPPGEDRAEIEYVAEGDTK